MADRFFDATARRQSLYWRALCLLLTGVLFAFGERSDTTAATVGAVGLVGGLGVLVCARIRSRHGSVVQVASLLEVATCVGFAAVSASARPGVAVLLGVYTVLGATTSDGWLIPASGLVASFVLAVIGNPRRWSAWRVMIAEATLLLVVIVGAGALRSLRNLVFGSTERRTRMIDRTGAVVWEMDRRTGEFSFVSGHASTWGLDPEEWLARADAWTALVAPSHRHQVGLQAMVECAERGLSIEVPMVPPAFNRLIRITPSLVRDPHLRQSCLQGVMVDITDRQHNESMIRREARHDGLTGLPNRLAVKERFDEALANRQPNVALLGLDLDKFKDVNDALGHDYGDLLLERVAERLTRAVGDTGVAARTGGDEFTILINGPDARATAQRVAFDIHRELTTPFIINGVTLHIGGSLGLASCPEDGSDAVTLQRRADVSMYAAKRAGGGLMLYDPEFEREAAIANLRSSRLPRALEQGAIHVHLQPRIDVRTGRIVGCEVLARWADPDLGEVSAADIIATAEAAGLGPQLAHTVIQQGLAAAARFGRLGHRLEIAFNLTTSGLISTGFVDMVRDELARNDVDAASMIIEIDERELLRNTRMLGEILGELATIGVRIAVDGFGAATVSLGWLRDSPIDVLKLAGSLVQHFDATPTDRAIAASLVQLAHHLDLHVVAQSVERSETLAIARELGCDSYQGVLFAPPLAPQEIEVLLRWQQSDGPVRTAERR